MLAIILILYCISTALLGSLVYGTWNEIQIGVDVIYRSGKKDLHRPFALFLSLASTVESGSQFW